MDRYVFPLIWRLLCACISPMPRSRANVMLAALMVASCSGPVLSTQRIARSTADLLGLEPGNITIVRLADRGLNTEYLARRPAGTTIACTVNASDPTLDAHRVAAAESPGSAADGIVQRGQVYRGEKTSLIGSSRSGTYAC